MGTTKAVFVSVGGRHRRFAGIGGTRNDSSAPVCAWKADLFGLARNTKIHCNPQKKQQSERFFEVPHESHSV